ncbi:Gfo/Idh/MocA family protein [Bosea sp. NBC_00550]|uniref:Gfo/Idh/MocA family protein n=1 Tax=Bosea sp. NBC_00550 TaxID=2969621 RepID=UPI00222F9825|nr:Gfo/Idh/MocA family oxidoreductase [Bosea sp. NBC_00550]UZF94389.1 Gfo/Idh/MocA family oxidoreductase [Bosea sp. NBC_00550]
MKQFRWGIFGTGAISAKFVAGLASATAARPEFIASRSAETARRFATELGIPRAIEGYAEAAGQGGVDAIYVATPPSEHAAHAQLCLEAGIPVLVEKPFGSSDADASSIVQTARDRSVFAMEAMWTRFLPAVQALRQKIAEGAIGRPRFVTGNFGTSQLPEERNGMFDPARGGGATLHLGAYPLSLGHLLFGTSTAVQATGTIGSTGVDEDAAFQLRYASGVTGSFFVSLRSWAPDTFHVLGEHGMLAVEGSLVRPYGLTVTREEPLRWSSAQFGLRARLQQHPFVHRLAQMAGRSTRSRGRASAYHYRGNGYHYEADEVRRCVEAGRTESAVMPLDDSLAVARTMSRIRADILSQDGLSKRNA